ncbi:alpha/beta hydrolase [Rhodococcus tukisamuensis]|uniref:Acetyl esterase/lipase n=1 Tax=Rhodococcus tukisamuensis TaxID=168276 RepID=A0A1G6Z0W9_9NOCA|nr:alpha/beta hydrolase [Rhodococcus tukisamuensis]SDD95466.1 Acetyl esterase/lipase [Rhodococcus tukisamuensis]
MSVNSTSTAGSAQGARARARPRRKPAATRAIAAAAEPTFVAGASLRSQVLAATVRCTVKPFIALWARCPGPLWPAGLVDLAARFLPPVRDVRRRRVCLPHCDAEWLEAGAVDDASAVLYLHGGGFLVCGLNTHRRLESWVSAAAKAAVLSVDYRMLPRHTIADSVADAVSGYRWLLAQGFAPERIAIAGDSAGGYLTFATALELDARGLQQPAALVALSPLTDMDPTAKLADPKAAACPVFPRSVLPVLTALADRAERHADPSSPPRVSPVDAALGALPPVLIQVGSTEILYPDAELMAQRLSAAGVPVTLEVWDRQIHVFHAAADWVPEAGRAIGRVGEFVRAHLAVGEAGTREIS